MRAILFTMLCAVLAPSLARAAAFDGSAPLICALRSVIECDEETGCEKGTPGSVNAPTFVRFDFEAMTVRGTRADQTERTSKIKRRERLDGKLYLQGADDGVEGIRDGLAWSVAIQEDSGEMVMSAAGDEVGFVVFGACTNP